MALGAMAQSLLATIRQTWSLGGVARVYAAAYSLLLYMPFNFPILLFGLDAPHGRFALQSSKFNLNGNVTWLLMEIVSPIAFLTGLSAAGPVDGRSWSSAVFAGGLSGAIDRVQALPWPTKVLAAAFLTHYANRSVISTLRQPAPRSPIHAFPAVFAAIFNLANGTLMGSWLAGRTVRGGSALAHSLGSSPLFYVGMTLWLAGFIGNVAHDEVLRRIRVDRIQQRKEAEKAGKKSGSGSKTPHYAVPHGLLYDAPLGGISYPNYLCEWVEWAGFAMASCAGAPPPALPSTVNGAAAFMASAKRLLGGGPKAGSMALLRGSTYLTPPWLFIIGEVGYMSPRAIRGHRWYRDQFGRAYPSRRRALIPGVL